LYDPGDDWSYGVSVRVLGDVIEAVSGQSLDVFLTERIFRPLGMQDTFFILTDDLENRRVHVYRKEDEGRSELPPVQSHLPLIIGDGSIITTGEDYARFLQMLLNDGTLDSIQILSKEFVNLMTQNQVGDLYVKELFNDFPPFAGRDKFGFGFQIASAVRDYDDRRSPGSYSWAGSYNSFFWVDPVDEIAVVLFMHYHPFFDETARMILDGFEERIYQNLR
jgi:methyl acetate hydrolase